MQKGPSARFPSGCRFFWPLLATILWLLPVSRAPGQDDAAPNKNPKTDPLAGKTVLDSVHVDELIGTRLNNAPKLGEKAPPFTLTDAKTGQAVTLAELHRDKPVVLYFASHSCITAQESDKAMKSLSERFGRLVQFAMIYIREAHPEGGFPPPGRGKPFVIADPAKFKERVAAAANFAREKGMAYPVLVDSMDDAAAVRWGAWPLRLFLIDRSGKVIFSGQQGPWFHRPTREFDPDLGGVPEFIKDLPGYSRESLEEFLEKLEKGQPNR